MEQGVMLNAYPDSIGGSLEGMLRFLEDERVRGAFTDFYILPSLYNTDLDRGFSVQDYGLNGRIARREDLERLKELGLGLKLDFILNHASALSPQFRDLLEKGEDSEYKDFFIDWNRFWAGCGEMTEAGYIQPAPEYIRDMFFRKPGLPLLMVRMPDGTEKPYWNTFYQEVRYRAPEAPELAEKLGLPRPEAEALAERVARGLEAGRAPRELDLGPDPARREALLSLLEAGRGYLGQMDLNIRSPRVWAFYKETLETLASYGARIVRLDAFAYAPKEPGARNFLNEPGTWELLEKVRALAEPLGLRLLPEIHASYAEGTYRTIAAKGYMTYDFFLPGLLIDALENGSGALLAAWARELAENGISTVNMLGCHDGIPLLDLKGLVPEERIGALIDRIVERGGAVKNLHGQKNVYYQVNATYYSALGEDDRKLLLARAVQLFMPGKPQVWYLDLLAGKNDHEAVRRAGAGGHKEINRTNLSAEQAAEALEKDVVRRQLALLRWRSGSQVFGPGAELTAESEGSRLTLSWRRAGRRAGLTADLSALRFTAGEWDEAGRRVFWMEQ